MNNEEIIYQYLPCKQSKKTIIGKVILFAAFGLILMFLSKTALPKNYILVLSLGFLLVTSALIRNFSVEYEYMLTDKVFSVTCIRGVSKRKEVFSALLSSITEIISCSDDEFSSIISKSEKVFDFSSSPDAGGRICLFIEKKSLAVIIEPEEKILSKIGLIDNV